MSLLDLLGSSLSGDAVDELSRQIGADSDKTRDAVSAAVPLLLGALARNARESQGAGALSDALERDHDGSILDDLPAFLVQGGGGRVGERILQHALGGKQEAVARGVSRSSGLDLSSVQQLLALLAPIVMGMLGRQQREQGLGADGLAAMLGRESRQAERQTGGLVAGLLDADGDGDVLDDVQRIGGGLLGGLRKR